MDVFGENLRHYREIQGKSMKEVADDIGVPYQTYVCWERDSRKPRKAALVDALAAELQIEKSKLYVDWRELENPVQNVLEDENIRKIVEVYARLNEKGRERLEQYARELTQIAGYLY